MKVPGKQIVSRDVRVLFLLVLPAVLTVGARPGWAGLGPDNVAVVVNADSWASKTVANHYIHLRDIPAVNVVYLKDLDGFQTMNVEPFRKQILLPVMEELYQRGVLSHIDCIAYSADLPTAINVKSDFADQKLEKYQTTVGSINGLTYLYQLVIAKRPEYLRLDVNYYMRRPTRSLSMIPRDPADAAAYRKALQLLAAKNWEGAAEALQALADRGQPNPLLQYNLACCLARLGNPDEAIDALIQAVKDGWSDRPHAAKDPDLASLQELPEFKALLTKMEENRQRPFDVQPTSGFGSQVFWNARGEQVTEQGIRYMLSTVLGVTSGRGNSVSEVIAGLQRSAKVDGTKPRGTVYFMENSDVRSRTRQPAFLSAAAALQKTPLEGKIEAGVLPQQKSDVAGAVVGKAGFSWETSGSTILPGAICEHLTSYGGAMLETNGQTPLSEFIRYGAAGTSGTVTEPYSIQAKFPFPFIHVHYARGATLAEAFYQSVAGPYQLLIVGDPLCQPWANLLRIQLDEPQENQPVSGRLVLQPKIIGGATAEAPLNHYELYIDSRQAVFPTSTRSLPIDTRKLGDGWQQLRIVAVGQGPLEPKSRLVVPVLVDNGTGGLELEVTEGASRPLLYGDAVSVRVTSPLSARIDVAANGNVLGAVEGKQGTLQLDTRHMGIGPVRLQAVSRFEGKPVFSRPVTLEVEPPLALQPAAPIDASRLKPGMRLTIGNGPPVVIESTRDAKWLEKQKPAAGATLQLEGYFSAPRKDLYQLQLRGNSVSEVRVDGQPLWQDSSATATGGGWSMVPVHLARGWHHLRLRGTAAQTPRLDIRFGNRGCQSLDSARFKHVP